MAVLRKSFSYPPNPKLLVFMAFMVFSLSFCYFAGNPVHVFQFSSTWNLGIHSLWIANPETAGLEGVLERAAMLNKTVIITTLNAAWAAPNSIIDLFLRSFKIGENTNDLLKHLVIVALDQKAFKRCKSIHSHCFFLATKGIDFSREKSFMTEDYLKMMWRRINFLRIVLELGYSFVFTDADIMWFRDPFPHFSENGDIQIACDFFLGNSSDLNNLPNGGFNYVRSNDKTVRFYKYWYMARKQYPDKHDQDVLNEIKHDDIIIDTGLKLRFLDTVYFGGFCQPSRDLNKVCTMHANCCVGLSKKLHDLKVVLEDWSNFKALKAKDNLDKEGSWRAPQKCR
ncbi:uncharacterized protein At4g15970 isoform X2 [Amborella trichopoda]|uniref:Glycosyltransferase n=1 Tax=Amborella trichopoda TaxID=13333 RepID=W1PQB8_AMBTC|nr:uncharacterized protein At4g15970 isoform X2 [Amborella trichopoda]ERN09999.1 hypothetical protein AMTR_s00013p00228040 [Amborella trichopoda]|eukprot:XP_006848418.1 uncharacterized protein At4g15970 isoform X2 [Amborella trichopoda]